MSALTQFVDGVLVDAPALNNLAANLDVLCQLCTGKTAASGVGTKPILKVAQTSSRSIANNSSVLISWDTALVNSDTMWSSGSTVTIQTGGWYEVALQVPWSGSASNLRSLYLFVNGLANPANLAAQADELGPTGLTRSQCRLYDRFTAGTTIQAACYQFSGAALSTDTAYGGVHMSVIFDAPI
jgi:hypothetical protein